MHALSPLQQAIEQLQPFRATLGDAAVDAAERALRQHAAGGADASPSAQRLRQVSVLFADVADSTAMLGRLPTEDASDLLGRTLQDFAAIVQRWGGQVLRFTGDGLKAAFGTQGLREDEAERAVRAGLQILDSAARHAQRVQQELGISGFGVRVGIHTGPVLLGGGVEDERSAMGQAVHLAARMEQSAPVGHLRISSSTWAQVRGVVRADEQPPLQVKGVEEPLRTWLVTGLEAGPEPTVQRGVEGVAAPMLGRAAELHRLRAWYEHGCASGQSGVALVLADAGMGKTRLRQEFIAALGLASAPGGAASELQPRVQGACLMQARAQPSSTLQAYGLLRQCVARWLDIADDLDAPAARDRLVQGLLPWLGAEGAHQAPRVGQLLGMDFSDHPAVQALGPAGLRKQAFAALRGVLMARAAQGPLLLVLDDLHWADEASLGFVQTLLAPAPQPLMLLLLARPALLERAGAPQLQPTRPAEQQAPPTQSQLQLRLTPLQAQHSADLLDALLQPLPDVPADLRQLLLTRASGNPFYLEALVRMLVDDGVIDTRQRPWRLLADRLATLHIPPSLVGVLQARLDALPASELLALQQASVVGAVFWDEALAAVAPGSLQALPALQQRALVHLREQSALLQATERSFDHALLHEVTYGTLLKGPRREGHARVAGWLSERSNAGAIEFLVQIAEHHERAGNSPSALEFWDRAQSQCYRRYANAEGLHCTERALAQPALTDTLWRFTLMVNRHELLERLGRADDARAARDEMAAYAEANDNDTMRAHLLSSAMLHADHVGRPDEARALALQALAAAARAGDLGAPAAALAHGELAWLAVVAHDFDTVAAQVAQGLPHARIAATLPRRHSGYEGYEQQLRIIALESLLQQERYVDALATCNEGLQRLPGGSYLQDQHNLLARRCRAERELGRLEEAAATAQQLRTVAVSTGLARLRIDALQLAGEAALRAGDVAAAAPCLDAAAAMAEVAEESYALPSARELQSEAAGLAGRPDDARALCRQARDLYQAQQQDHLAQQLTLELAGLDFAAGEHTAARAAVRELLAATRGEWTAKLGAGGWRPAALLAAHGVLAGPHARASSGPRDVPPGTPGSVEGRVDDRVNDRVGGRIDDLLDDAAPAPAEDHAWAAALLEALQQRLQAQLAALPDDAARSRLLTRVPHWRALQALRAQPGTGAAR